MNDDMNDEYADSDFLAKRDLAVSDFRTSEKETKHKIIEKMLTLRHNMKYNKHLLSVYIRAKGLFDTMIEEHRSQLYYLDEIYRHINQLIRENLSTVSKKDSGMMSELVKDKKRIGTLLKNMRISYDKLMNVDTVIGVTIDKMNEITFMEDDAQHAQENGSDSGVDEDEEPSDDALEEYPEEEENGIGGEEDEDEDSASEEEEEEDDRSSEEGDLEDIASEDKDEDEDDPVILIY